MTIEEVYQNILNRTCVQAVQLIFKLFIVEAKGSNF